MKLDEISMENYIAMYWVPGWFIKRSDWVKSYKKETHDRLVYLEKWRVAQSNPHE